MYYLEKAKNQIAQEINKALGKELVQASDLVYPPNPEMGDLSFPVFNIAQKINKNPNEVVSILISNVKDKTIAGTKAAGPYFNITLKKDILAKEVVSEVGKKKSYGQNSIGKQKRVMVEFTNANTHKEYHVGHLRNLCFGDSVHRILKANGYKTISTSYINDFGIHVAKTLWAYLEFYKDKELPANKGRFLGEIYVRASKELAENKIANDLVKLMMKKIETRKGEEYKLWQKTRKWTIEQFDQIYQEMDIKLDQIFYESDFIDKGRVIVNKLIKQGILRESQGAIIADLEKYKLGVLVILRSDGTATYPVADLPLAKAKIEKYKLDKSIYVVDNRQALYFKQLFKILELMGYKQDLIHLPHDFVKLPEGMMASRSGNVVTYDDLKEQLFKKAFEETKKRHEDWSDEKIEKISKAIVNGAIKFEMLKVSANQIITFDVNKSLSFQGYTAAYLQYTFARISSIIKKSKVNIKDLKINPKLFNDIEHGLIIKFAKYPEIVKHAGAKYDPSELAKYLFELAQGFNDYYHQVQILKSEDDVKESRLVLIYSVSQVIKNGLDLLGIKVVKEM